MELVISAVILCRCITNWSTKQAPTCLLHSLSSKLFLFNSLISSSFDSFFAHHQRVQISDSFLGSVDTTFKQKIIDYRRCIVLAVVGCTQTESTSLASVVLDGYLCSVKVWLDDILSPPLGMLLVAANSSTNIFYLRNTVSFLNRFCWYASTCAIEYYKFTSYQSDD